jgi:hypothetical protein
MIIKDRFRMQVVVDPATNAPIEGATFTVYDATDTGMTTPLTVTDMTDIPMTLTSGPLGIIPDFQVVGHYQVLVVSADGTVTPLDSMLSFLLSVWPDPTLLADGYIPKTSGGEWIAAPMPTGGGGGASAVIRHDTAGGYDYMGVAPVGTPEATTGWVLTRITIATPTTVLHGVDSWANHLTAVYS